MVQEDYVTFETAKLLNNKGFNEETDHNMWYVIKSYGTGVPFNMISYNVGDVTREYSKGHCILMPTLQMAMKWLREEHNVFIDVYTLSPLEYCYRVCLISDTTGTLYQDYACEEGERFYSYKEACEFAIQYCLENILDGI